MINTLEAEDIYVALPPIASVMLIRRALFVSPMCMYGSGGDTIHQILSLLERSGGQFQEP